MKKTKKFFAICGIAILAILYTSSLIFALLDNPLSSTLFNISMILTFIVPILLYALLFIYKLINKNNKED